MRLSEIVIDFPIDKKKVLRTGKVKPSNVIGKMPDGRLVYTDEITGLPIVYNDKNVPFHVTKTESGFEYPEGYEPDQVPQTYWVVIDPFTQAALGKLHDSREEAELEAKQFRRWHKRSVKVIPI